MGKFAKTFVLSCILLFSVALFPAAAFADGEGASGDQSLTVSSPLLGESENGLVEHSTHVALIQEGAVPSAAEAGTPWDGMAAASGKAKTKLKGMGLSAQAIDGVDTAKSRILKALMDVRQGEINLEDCNIPTSDISSLYASVINSCPDLFYVSGSLDWSTKWVSENTFVVKSITPSYNYDVTTIKSQMKPAYESAFRDMLSWVPQNALPVEKVKAVHDWLVRNCAYNTDAEAQGYYGYPSKNPWEAYGALVDKRPVCQGYSLAFKAAMNALGVPCGYLTANNHGWNIVQVPVNGVQSWFHVDTTWDDPVPDGGFYSVRTDYFMKSDGKVLAVDQARGQSVHVGWTQNYHAYDTTYDGWTTGWPSYSGQASLGALSLLSLNASSMWMLTDTQVSLSVSSLSAVSYGVFRARWSSSNSEIVAVDSVGRIVSGGKVGVAVIACELGGQTARCLVMVKKPLKNARVSIAKRSYPYTGSAIRPVPTVVLDGVTLKRDMDYTVTYKNDVAIGTATMCVQGIGYYVGQWELKYTISKRSLAGASMSAIRAKAYTGKAFKPAPAVVLGGKTLARGTDYMLSYNNNVKAGTATVTATGKGVYEGSVSRTFKIAKAGNYAKVSTTGKKATFKAKKKTKRLASTKKVALPKVATKFGAAKWKVVAKDKRGVLSLKSGKVKVKKGAKRRTYTIKLRAYVAQTANYKDAISKTVTVKVKVK